MQRVIASFGDEYRFLDLPDPDNWLMPGVRWGSYEHALTPAFWVSMAWMKGAVPSDGFRLGSTLAEEVTACLLGGYGLPAEVGLAAFTRVRNELRATKHNVLTAETLERILNEPLAIGHRRVRYRFARQRARYLSAALKGLQNIDEQALDDVALRDALCTLPGIGPKTASWIVRNRRASDHIAILDIHIVRASQIMKVFPERVDPARHYAKLERRFLEFCTRSDTRASVMDAVIWGTMRSLSKDLLDFLIDPHGSFREPRPIFQQRRTPCQEAATHGATQRRVQVAEDRLPIRAQKLGGALSTAPRQRSSPHSR